MHDQDISPLLLAYPPLLPCEIMHLSPSLVGAKSIDIGVWRSLPDRGYFVFILLDSVGSKF